MDTCRNSEIIRHTWITESKITYNQWEKDWHMFISIKIIIKINRFDEKKHLGFKNIMKCKNKKTEARGRGTKKHVKDSKTFDIL